MKIINTEILKNQLFDLQRLAADTALLSRVAHERGKINCNDNLILEIREILFKLQKEYGDIYQDLDVDYD